MSSTSQSLQHRTTQFGLRFYPPHPGYMAVLNGKHAGQLRRINQKPDLDVPVHITWTGAAFRPKSESNPGTEIAIACGEKSTHVKRFDLELCIEENQPLGLVELFMPRAHCVAYSHNGRYLALGSTDGLVRVYDLNADHLPKELCCVRVSKGCIAQLAFSATNDYVFAVCDTHAYIIRPLNEQAEAAYYLVDKDDKKKPFDHDFYCVATHPNIKLVAFAGLGNQVWLVNIDKGWLVNIPTNVGGFIRELDFVEGPEQLTVVGQTGVEGYDLETRKVVGNWTRTDDGQKPLSARSYQNTVYVTRLLWVGSPGINAQALIPGGQGGSH